MMKISRRERVDENLQDISPHATNRTSLDSSGIGVIKKFEAGQEISVADGPPDNTSEDNTYGKEQERGEVHFEEQESTQNGTTS
jgi:hypothetical protein